MLKDYSNEQIEEVLLKGPHKIRVLGLKVVEAKREWELKKALYNNTFNKTLVALKASRAQEKLTVQDLKALAEDDCYDLSLEVIESQAIYEKARVEEEYAKNKWDSSRSDLKYRCTEMQTGVRE